MFTIFLRFATLFLKSRSAKTLTTSKSVTAQPAHKPLSINKAFMIVELQRNSTPGAPFKSNLNL
jgi:hypothetical protein